MPHRLHPNTIVNSIRIASFRQANPLFGAIVVVDTRVFLHSNLLTSHSQLLHVCAVISTFKILRMDWYTFTVARSEGEQKYIHECVNCSANTFSPLRSQSPSRRISVYTSSMAGTQTLRASSVDEQVDGSAPQSPSSLTAIRSSAVFSAAKKLVQVRENLTEFHKKGGIVGWLHGDETEVRVTESVDEDANKSDESGDSFALAYSPKRPSREAFSLSLRPSSPVPGDEGAEGVDNGLHTPPSPRSTTTSPTKSYTPPSSPMSKRQSYSSSVIESLYEKVLKASNSSSSNSPRLSLQPSPRRKSGRVDVLVSGFDDFVGADGSRRSRYFRDRTSSDSNMLRRSSSAQSFPSRGRAWTSLPEVAPVPTLTLDDCLGDPKLAAEFACVSLPEDGALLAFYFALNEFVCNPRVSAASARTLIEALNVLRERTKAPNLTTPSSLIGGGVGPRAAAAFMRIPSTSAINLSSLDTTDTPPAAVSLLIRSAHAAVYAALEVAFDQHFRISTAYQRALIDRQARLNSVDPTKLFVDALLNDEWASFVLWTFQFRLKRHQRLSFLIDVRFRLERVFSACMVSSGDRQRFAPLVKYFHDIHRKYLATSAPVALPSSSSEAERLRVSAIARIVRLASANNDSDDDYRARLVATMEGVRALARAERNSLVASEHFTEFSSSSLFRDFVALPTAPRGDMVRLLRTANIPFHQAPKGTDDSRDMVAGAAKKKDVKDLIYRVLLFEERQGSTLEFKQIFRCSSSCDDVTQTEDGTLLRTVEGLIVPSRTNDVNVREKATLFHFVSGTGKDTLYGAVLQFYADSMTQGLCVLARAPLIESLRCYLLSLWRCMDVTKPVAFSEISTSSIITALEAAENALNDYLATHSQSEVEENSSTSMPFLDTKVERLFVYLPLSTILRTFGCLVSERKVLLVSASRSKLIESGEAFRSLLFPLQWPHVFAPVLPLALHEFLQCPSPFLFGMQASSVQHCELPTDVAVVDLDCGDITGDDVHTSDPALTALETQLTQFYRIHASTRDNIDGNPVEFPETAARRVFETHVRSLVSTLETTAFRFETTDSSRSNDNSSRTMVAVMDTSSTSGVATSPLMEALRQSQAFSAHLCRPAPAL